MKAYWKIGAATAAVAASLLFWAPVSGQAHSDSARLADGSGGNDWPAFGRTFGEQHFSPLAEVNDGNVSRLGLAWSLDLPPGNAVTGPLAVDGVLYFAAGYSVVRAVDAATGKLLWEYDPKAPEASGRKLRMGWGSRGIAWWNGKIYTGTQDGRLIALDAATGQPVWSVMTVGKDDYRFISGPPRVFDGKVIIGHGGADSAATRGYVTTYDAETGGQLWRFYTVPGNPADGFENKAMEMAAKTWSGEWWKLGGGGTVWNAMTYDAETDTVLLGVGNGAPWNRKIRSEDKGDNLFLASIVALDGKTGAYKWHYQVNPGESWDYNASMDIELADLDIGGVRRKVAMTAPKNGFFYVIDRINGQLISAEPFVKVTWASHIDLKTGRPVENPDARYRDGKTFTMWPGPVGAHSWMPMAFSPKTGLVYIPAIEMSTSYNDVGVNLKNWQRTPGNAVDGGANPGFVPGKPDPLNGTSLLLAWNPVTQKPVWKAPNPGPWNGGVVATGGNLVFQGQVDGAFNAYAADSGKLVWSYAAQAPVIAPPITYSVKGRQYVTVLTGFGTSAGAFGPLLPVSIDYRTQARRVLTFALDGTATLPKSEPVVIVASDDPEYKADEASAERGKDIFARRCATCHGVAAIAAGAGPDLRASPIPSSLEAFTSVVRDGMLVPAGMPRFEELTDDEIRDISQYIRSRAKAMAPAK